MSEFQTSLAEYVCVCVCFVFPLDFIRKVFTSSTEWVGSTR